MARHTREQLSRIQIGLINKMTTSFFALFSTSVKSKTNYKRKDEEAKGKRCKLENEHNLLAVRRLDTFYEWSNGHEDHYPKKIMIGHFVNITTAIIIICMSVI